MVEHPDPASDNNVIKKTEEATAPANQTSIRAAKDGGWVTHTKKPWKKLLKLLSQRCSMHDLIFDI